LKNITYHPSTSLFLYNHPELYYISENFNKVFVYPFTQELDNILTLMIEDENVVISVLLLTHIVIIGLLVLAFMALYFSYYNSSVKEENTIDHDFLCSNATLEAEEEVGSVDDLIIGVTMLLYIYFWYFYINF